MIQTKHLNNGNCLKCLSIINLYPGFYPKLKDWFLDLQKQDPTAHVSCAGRDQEMQELFFRTGASHARYGDSAHNYNLALDLFRLTQSGGLSYDLYWFNTIVAEAVEPWMEWYGSPTAIFKELPHIQVRDWRSLNYPLIS